MRALKSSAEIMGNDCASRPVWLSTDERRSEVQGSINEFDASRRFRTRNSPQTMPSTAHFQKLYA
jgi:hypothetical protein